jgi:anti-sigma factor RsiW
VKDCNIEDISVYIDGEMPEAEAACLRGHLAECPSCSALYNDLSALRDGFDCLDVPPPDTLAPGIMYKIGLGGEPSRTARIVRSLVAVAACLVAVLVISRMWDDPAEPHIFHDIMPMSDTSFDAAGGESWNIAPAEIAPRVFADEEMPLRQATTALPEAIYGFEADGDDGEEDEEDEEEEGR